MRLDGRLCHGTSCRRMCSPGTLLLGALSPFFMRWCPLMLEAAGPPSCAGLLGASWFAMVPQVLTYRKEPMPIAACTIGQETQRMSLSRHLGQ